MNIYIWLDDERPMPAPPFTYGIVIHARDYNSAVFFVDSDTYPSDKIYLDFDHDLGEGKSGYDVAKYIVENNIQNVCYHVHSMNPVGRANIEQLLDHYGDERF